MAKKIDIEIHNKLAVIPSEAGALLSTSEDVIKIYMNIGELPFMKVGKEYKIWVSDLMELKEKLRYKKLDREARMLVDCDYKDVLVYNAQKKSIEARN